jgi:hypothetical protein
MVLAKHSFLTLDTKWSISYHSYTKYLLLNVYKGLCMKLQLNLFVTYKQQKNAAFEFFPEPKAIRINPGQTTIVINDVPLPSGVPVPDRAITALYGFRDPLEELKKQYAIAKKNGMSLVKVSFDLEVGKIPIGTTNKEDVPCTSFLNLHRLSADLQALLIDDINQLSAKEGKWATFFDKIDDVGARPDLVCEAVRSNPMYGHIKVIVYKIKNGESVRQVATIFTSDVSNIVFRGEMPFDIELPLLNQKFPAIKIDPAV